MAEARVERRLAAILAADVVGYSRLMGADEAGTLTSLKRHRETIFDPAVAAHNGRIVKLMGDGAIVEFGSVVDAVNCALSVQRSGASMPDEKAFQPTIVLRIGINLGDVIIENDDIYGDGVNIAARLEPLAEPGGICISSIVNESVGNRIDVRFTDGGDISIKNIDRPIRIWTWHPDKIVATAKRSATANPEPRIEMPSIAVLPFTNMSGDAEQEYFVDGMVEEITTAIARLPWLFAIARNSAFTYKGRAVDVKQVAQELGVRYVLEGSVRKAGNRVRITGQLIDTTTGAYIWADRFDGALDDIFELQDQVASSVAGAIEPKLRQSEIERATRKPTANLTAYDLYLRALAQSYRYTDEAFAEAVVLAREALAIDPSYAPAAAMVGWCRIQQRTQDGERCRMRTPAKPAVWPARRSKPRAMTPRRFGRRP